MPARAIALRMAVLAGVAALFLAATTSAAALALRGSDADLLQADLSSRLSADYAADPKGVVFQPLSPEIIAAADRDAREEPPAAPRPGAADGTQGRLPQAPLATATATAVAGGRTEPKPGEATASPPPSAAPGSPPPASPTDVGTAPPAPTHTPRPADTATPILGLTPLRTPVTSIDPVETVKPEPSQTPEPTQTPIPTATATATPRPQPTATRTPAIVVDLPIATAIPCVPILFVTICP